MTPTSRGDPGRYTPLKASLVWLGGTYLLFLLVGEVGAVENLGRLTAFIVSTIACLALGYWLRVVIHGWNHHPCDPQSSDPDDISKVRGLVVLSAIHYFVYGIAYMREYGVESLSAVTGALTDPASAYLAKFDVYERQIATGASSPAAQVLTLLAVLSAPLVPFLVIYWNRLTGDIRILGLVALTVYSAFYLAIGTLSGIGSVLIYLGVSLMVVRGRGTRRGLSRRRRNMLIASGAIAAVAFTIYMSHNQGARLAATGAAKEYDPNPIVEKLTNEQFARGVTVTAAYPTHGYQGLAYNLETDFEWTHGRGAARALDGYLTQYGFEPSVALETYPARTEARTGWPAGQYWATIYPWLASDLTFPGAALFMGVVGWWMARWWYESVVLNSRLAVLLLCQVGVLIAFVPANNQLGISRPSLITVGSLLMIYTVSRMIAGTRSRRRVHIARTRPSLRPARGTSPAQK